MGQLLSIDWAKLTNRKPVDTQNEMAIINIVLLYHPLVNNDITRLLEIWHHGGFGLIEDMLATAKNISQLELLVQSYQEKIEETRAAIEEIEKRYSLT